MKPKTFASKKEYYSRMNDVLTAASPRDWEDIAWVLSQLKDSIPLSPSMTKEKILQLSSRGAAFVTFDYGIDGVSTEISKYARSLVSLLEGWGEGKLHFIGGDFYSQADSVLEPGWYRFRIEGINGWSKWDRGKWFSALFYEDMPEASEISSDLAQEIYWQAVSIAQRMGGYLVENDISLLIPVNIASNPGNLALTLALVMVTEAMGIYVINSNHDFFWDGGKPAPQRAPGEPPGIRDHFFRNVDNKPFFELFETLYPWNGHRWLQVNINRLQSLKLIEEYAFPEKRVFELSTCVSDEFFEGYTQEDVKIARLRMGHILSGGKPIMAPLPVEVHIQGLDDWMNDQTPRILGARSGLRLDPTSDDLIYLLQPTRIVTRKRIERNLYLIKELLTREPFRSEFDNRNLQLVMHITGPTPIEHQADHERVLQAYCEVLETLPTRSPERVFLAFSVGHEYHPSFLKKNFQRMHIEDIYRMATAVLFPSKIEGRGLPIIESSACGVPIVCSRYNPQEVFAEVVGEHLPERNRIKYTLFPEGVFTDAFLSEVTQLFLHPELNEDRIHHNKSAVRSRYSTAVLRESFKGLLDTLASVR